MIDRVKLNEKYLRLGNELYTYINLEGTEIAEEASTLLLIDTRREFYSDEFIMACYRELCRILEFFRRNSKIVKMTKEIPARTDEWDDLVWNEDADYEWPMHGDLNNERWEDE